MNLDNCNWHKGDQPVPVNIGCEYCGTMLDTKECEGCRQEFLDWEAKGYDDIIAAPYVSSSGDLMCARCGPQYDRDEEEREQEEYEYDEDYY